MDGTVVSIKNSKCHKVKSVPYSPHEEKFECYLDF